MNFIISMERILLSAVLSFSLPFAIPLLSQAKPPLDRPAPPPITSESINYRQMERAGHELSKAEEKAYEIKYLSGQVSLNQATELVAMAERILLQARSAYNSGQYFQATEQAMAAKDAYEAAKSLYTGQLGYSNVSNPRGSVGLSPSYYEAPYKAQEDLARAQAEMSYYQVNSTTNNPLIADLINRAKSLSTSPEQATGSNNVSYLASSRAASHLAKASIHLMRAERGF